MTSEITQLRAQIAEEYTAATWALYGFRDGAAKHQFITHRMEHIGDCHESLKGIVGENIAGRLMMGAMEESHDELQRALAELNATPSYAERLPKEAREPSPSRIPQPSLPSSQSP